MRTLCFTKNANFLKLFLVLTGVFYVVYLKLFAIQFEHKNVSKEEPLRQKEEGTIWTHVGLISIEEANSAIFRPLGYLLVENTTIPALTFMNPPKCSKVFEGWLAGSSAQNESAPPPRIIPKNLMLQFTLNGYMQHIDGYMDDRSGTRQATWTKEMIDKVVNTEVRNIRNYEEEGHGVYHAMKVYGVKDQSGIVIGSLTPWVESFAIRLGAAKVKTIEYMKIKLPEEYPWFSYEHPVGIAKNYEKHLGAYDFAVSFSSIEHSGLGRFGDALDPIGDIKESLKVFCMLKEGGLFFLAVPTGKDILYWNLHRNYGRLRWAILAAGFDIIDMFYMDQRVLLTPEWFLEKDGGQPAFMQSCIHREAIACLAQSGCSAASIAHQLKENNGSMSHQAVESERKRHCSQTYWTPKVRQFSQNKRNYQEKKK